MISRLRGTIVAKKPEELALEIATDHLTYEVATSMQTFYHLPVIGQEIVLFTQQIFREDAQQLFGFYTEQERRLFRTLLKASGVGTKLAIGILSSIAPDDFVRCVMLGDRASLTRIPGLGKKTVERLLLEMRDRLQGWSTPETISTDALAAGNTLASPQQEALSALIALGYKPAEVNMILQSLQDQNYRTEELIRLVLKRMGEERR